MGDVGTQGNVMGERAILRVWREGDTEPYPVVMYTHWGGRVERMKEFVGKAYARIEKDVRESFSLDSPWDRAEPDAILPLIVAEAVETGIRLFPGPPIVDVDLLATVDHGVYNLYVVRTAEGVRWRLTNVRAGNEERVVSVWVGIITPDKEGLTTG